MFLISIINKKTIFPQIKKEINIERVNFTNDERFNESTIPLFHRNPKQLIVFRLFILLTARKDVKTPCYSDRGRRYA